MHHDAHENILWAGPNGEDMSEEWPSVLVPPGLTLKMLSTLPVAFGSTGPSTIQQPLDAIGIIRYQCMNQCSRLRYRLRSNVSGHMMSYDFASTSIESWN